MTIFVDSRKSEIFVRFFVSFSLILSKSGAILPENSKSAISAGILVLRALSVELHQHEITLQAPSSARIRALQPGRAGHMMRDRKPGRAALSVSRIICP
ncbi:MAG: hypothetical protein PUF51_02895, partial [Bifidobacteriaceae bacterium]|nr:hypothetical protein [Bifidobacteriaceae bacterium]